MQSRPSSPALDSCLKLVWEHDPENGKFNPDSVMVDTCDAEQHYYAKRGFRICVPQHILDTTCGDPRALQSLDCADTTHAEYQRLLELDSLFGSYKVSWVDTWHDLDSVFLGYQYQVAFDSIRRNSSVVDSLESWFPSRHTGVVSRLFRISSEEVEEEEEDPPASQQPEPLSEPWALPVGYPLELGPIEPIADAEYWMWSRMYQRGLLSPYYDLKVPMVWKITQGTPNVYLVLAETPGAIDPDDEFEHIDLQRFESQGNFSRPGARAYPLLWTSDHFLRNAGPACAQLNGIGTVGVAPRCRIIHAPSEVNVSDVNQSGSFIVNPQFANKLPHVVGVSLESGDYGRGDPYFQNMGAGLVVTAPLVYWAGDRSGAMPGKNVYWDPESIYDRTNPKIEDEPDPKNDIKLLTVGYCSQHMQSGHDLSRTGVTLHRGIPNDDCTYRVNPIGGISNNHAFGSAHANKFSTWQSPNGRTAGSAVTPSKYTKSKAPLDIVVPTIPVTLVSNNAKESLYSTDTHGQFQMGLVSGVIGLMMSVKDRLGQERFGVHRRAYDIVTFTADKLVDPLGDDQDAASLGYGSSDPSLKGLPPNQDKLRTSYRSMRSNEYGVENYDHLDRYWAIRMGFGRLNAFRSVAHSIPGVGTNSQPNVKYTYAGTDNLDWANAHEMDGNNGLGMVKYLHLGKYKNATELVLEHGGVKFEGEPDYLNSNGKTFVNKNLSVGNAQGLVVDGILETTNAYGSAPVISTTSEGRVLITGWMKGVRLKGRIYAVDLRVVNVDPTPPGYTPLSLSCEDGQSEIHDTLWLRQNTHLVVEDGGTLDLMPGAIVIMSQGSSIKVKSGGKVNLHHAARIVPAATYTTNQPIVTIEGGGEMATVYRYDDVAGRVAEQSENIVIQTRLSLNANSTLRVKPCVDFVYPSLDVYVITADPAANIILEPNAYLRQRNQATSGVAGGIRFPTLVAPVGGAAARYRVDIPTTIPAGPLVVVPTNTNLELGRVKVEYNGGLWVGPGTTLTLLEKEVEWNGILHVQGTSGNRATVRGAMELNQNLCGQALASRRAWPTLLKMIPSELPFKDLNYNDNRPDTAKLGCYLLLDWARMENVFTRTTSMPILGHNGTVIAMGFVSNTEFRADRDEIHEALGTNSERERFAESQRHLLDVEHNTALLTEYRLERSNATSVQAEKWGWAKAFGKLNNKPGLTLSSASFRDDAGPIALTETGSSSSYVNRKLENWYAPSGLPYYVVGGVKVDKLETLNITSSGFANLAEGVFGGRRSCLYVSDSYFSNIIDGIIGDYIRVCQSNFARAYRGVSNSRGRTTVIDCKFGAPIAHTDNAAMTSSESAALIGIGIDVESGNLSVRSSTFQDYNSAIAAIGNSRVEMRDYRVCNTPTCNGIAVWGRNAFKGIHIASTEKPWSGGDLLDIRGDLIFRGTQPKYHVRCGLNDHSGQYVDPEYPNYRHVPEEDLDTETSIDPNANEFNTGVLPRVIRVFRHPELVNRKKETITDECATGDKLRAAAPEEECVPAMPPPSSGWDVVHAGDMGLLEFSDRYRPGDMQADLYPAEQVAARLVVSNNYWRYNEAPTDNRIEWLIHHIELLKLDTLYPTNADSVLAAMSVVLADTNQDVVLRRQVLTIASNVLYDREDCSAVVQLHTSMMPVLYTQQELDAMYFVDAPLWLCNPDSLSSDSLRTLQNIELIRYIDRYGVEDTLSKRRWSQESVSTSNDATMRLSVIPNPASDVVSVCATSTSIVPLRGVVTLSSMLGMPVTTRAGLPISTAQDCVSIATSHLPRGVYFVRVEAGGSFATSMLVLQ